MLRPMPEEIRKWLSEDGYQLLEDAPQEVIEMYDDYLHPNKRALEEAKKRNPHILDIFIQ